MQRQHVSVRTAMNFDLPTEGEFVSLGAATVVWVPRPFYGPSFCASLPNGALRAVSWIGLL